MPAPEPVPGPQVSLASLIVSIAGLARTSTRPPQLGPRPAAAWLHRTADPHHPPRPGHRPAPRHRPHHRNRRHRDHPPQKASGVARLRAREPGARHRRPPAPVRGGPPRWGVPAERWTWAATYRGCPAMSPRPILARPASLGARRTTRRWHRPPSRQPIPRKVVKGSSHLCAPNYYLRYRPTAKVGRWTPPDVTSASAASSATSRPCQNPDTCRGQCLRGADNRVPYHPRQVMT